MKVCWHLVIKHRAIFEARRPYNVRAVLGDLSMTGLELSDDEDAMLPTSTRLKEYEKFKAECQNVADEADVDGAVMKLDLVIQGMDRLLKHEIYKAKSATELSWIIFSEPWQEMVDNLFEIRNSVNSARKCLRPSPRPREQEVHMIERATVVNAHMEMNPT